MVEKLFPKIRFGRAELFFFFDFDFDFDLRAHSPDLERSTGRGHRVLFCHGRQAWHSGICKTVE